MKHLIGKLINRFKSDFKDQKVVIAVSGGVDSLLISELAVLAEIDAHYFHFHHGQGIHDDSCFAKVAKFFEMNNIPKDRYKVVFGDYNEYFDKSKGFEASARKARYAEMKKYADKIGSKIIVTGHNLDDQVETMFMQIARGLTFNAIGMHRITNFSDIMSIYRPLLETPKSEIYQSAKALKIDWHEDETNSDSSIERNMWRNLIIPQLKKRRNILKTVPGVFGDKEYIRVETNLFD